MGELANAIWSARLAACSTTAAVFSMALSMAVPRKAAARPTTLTTSAAPVAVMKSCTEAASCARRVGRGRVRSGQPRLEGGREKNDPGGCVFSDARCRIRRASAHLVVPGWRATRG